MTAPDFPPTRAAALAAALRARLAGEVRFDDGSRALYATDGSNYRQVPIGVVIPRSIEDVIATVRLCREHDAPVLSRGGGTSLAGQCCNVAVVMDFSKYLHRILDLDTAGRFAHVEPGCVLDHLRDTAERHHLTFGPDPATHDHNTLGGMIGNNSCGSHSVMAGRTSDNVEALEVLTYDGLRLWVGPTSDEELEQIIRDGGRRGELYGRLRALRDTYAEDIRAGYPEIPRRVSGYNLPALLPERGFHVARALVGSEATCVTVLQAKLRLVHSPVHRVLALLGFEDVFEAGDAVPQVLEHRPIALEGLDDLLIRYVGHLPTLRKDLNLLPAGKGWLVAEIGDDDRDQAIERARTLAAAMQGVAGFREGRVLTDPIEQHEVWKVREAGLAATAHVPGQADTWEGWEDSAVPPEKVGAYLRVFRQTLDRYGYTGSLYGHFGDGCIHTRIDFDLRSEAGIRRYREFVGEMADRVVEFGGSFSGEHGDGQSRAELLPKLFSPRLMAAMSEFKRIWDPDGRMNPGKIIDPYPITSNLRLGTGFRPAEPAVAYAYPEDGGSFVHASLRCVGVGTCRRRGGGVMCPSYMATNEEKHSTRGRARLLFEMVHGGPIKDGWRSKAVRESLELCLACKGCKKDCPVQVDMATYKSEFMAHHYHHRLRPRTHYSLGLIHRWARLASHAPGLVNGMLEAPLLGPLAKRLGGIAPERQLPLFARQTFRAWHREHTPVRSARKVVLFVDTFNEHFRPEVARAALAVLEHAGYEAILPPRPLCCGRPLYDIGMLDTARGLLRELMDSLHGYVADGLPIVALEPACLAALKDELPNLFPHDRRAREIAAHSRLFSEFLTEEDVPLPRFERKALLHVHCHQHALIGAGPDTAVLERLGVDCQLLDAGCCGMAGAFGFERGEHYRVSQRAGERVLLPAVRAAAEDTLTLTNGFSCAEQVRQGTGVRPLHLAEVVRQAIAAEQRS